MTELMKKYKPLSPPPKVLRSRSQAPKQSPKPQQPQTLAMRANFKQWYGSDSVTQEIQNIKDNIITEQNMQTKFYQPNDETAILQSLKSKIDEILKNDPEDPLFGQTEDDPKPIIQNADDIQIKDLTVEEEIRQNNSITLLDQKLDTIDDLEMMNVAFDGVVQQLTQLKSDNAKLPPIIETLVQLKTYYVNKIVNKSTIEKAFTAASEQMDKKCQALVAESDALRRDNIKLTKDYQTIEDKMQEEHKKLMEQVEIYQDLRQQNINLQGMIKGYINEIQSLQATHDRDLDMVTSFKQRSKTLTDLMIKAKQHLRTVVNEKTELVNQIENFKNERIELKIQIQELQSEVLDYKQQLQKLNQEYKELQAQKMVICDQQPEDDENCIQNMTLHQVFGKNSQNSYIKEAINALMRLSTNEYQQELQSMLNISGEDIVQLKLIMEKIYYASNADELMKVIKPSTQNRNMTNVGVQVEDSAYKHLISDYGQLTQKLSAQNKAYDELRKQFQQLRSKYEYETFRLQQNIGSQHQQKQTERRRSSIQPHTVSNSKFAYDHMYYLTNLDAITIMYGDSSDVIEIDKLQQAQDNQHIKNITQQIMRINEFLPKLRETLKHDLKLCICSHIDKKSMGTQLKRLVDKLAEKIDERFVETFINEINEDDDQKNIDVKARELLQAIFSDHDPTKKQGLEHEPPQTQEEEEKELLQRKKAEFAAAKLTNHLFAKKKTPNVKTRQDQVVTNILDSTNEKHNPSSNQLGKRRQNSRVSLHLQNNSSLVNPNKNNNTYTDAKVKTLKTIMVKGKQKTTTKQKEGNISYKNTSRANKSKLSNRTSETSDNEISVESEIQFRQIQKESQEIKAKQKKSAHSSRQQSKLDNQEDYIIESSSSNDEEIHISHRQLISQGVQVNIIEEVTDEVKELAGILQRKMTKTSMQSFKQALKNETGEWDFVIGSDIKKHECKTEQRQVNSKEMVVGEQINEKQPEDQFMVKSPMTKDNKQGKVQSNLSFSQQMELDSYRDSQLKSGLQDTNLVERSSQCDIADTLHTQTFTIRKALPSSSQSIRDHVNSPDKKVQPIYKLTAINYIEQPASQELLEQTFQQMQRELEKDQIMEQIIKQDGGYKQYRNTAINTDNYVGLDFKEVQTEMFEDEILSQSLITKDIVKLFQDDGANLDEFDPRSAMTTSNQTLRLDVDIQNVLLSETKSKSISQQMQRNADAKLIDYIGQSSYMKQRLQQRINQTSQSQNEVVLDQSGGKTEPALSQQGNRKQSYLSGFMQDGMPDQILIRNQNIFKLKRVITDIKPSYINMHPKTGNIMRQEYSFVIPEIQQFVLVHYKDNIIMRYYPDNFENIGHFYPCVLVQFNVKQYKQLNTLTKQQFTALYNDPTQKIPQGQSLLPKIEDKLQSIRLSSLQMTGNANTQPIFFKLIAKTFGYQIKFVQFNGHQYVQIPFQNITLRSLNWTVRLIRSIIDTRVGQSCSFLKLLVENQSDLNVTQTFNYELFQSQLDKQSFDNLAGFTVGFIKRKYGQANVCLQLIYSLLANIAFYQYESQEVYLFTRMLLGDLDDDYFLLYCEMRNVLGLSGQEEEFVHIDIIPRLVHTLFPNWGITRIQLFCEQVYAILYAKAPKTADTTAGAVSFGELSQLLLFSFGVYRAQVHKEYQLVIAHLLQEQKNNKSNLPSDVISEGSFKQLMAALLPLWPDSSVYEFFYHHKQLIKTDDGQILQGIRIWDLDNIFVSNMLGRFIDISTDILNKIINLDCKRLTMRISSLFRQIQPVVGQVTMYLTNQKNKQSIQAHANDRQRIEQRFMSTIEKIRIINKQVQQDIVIYDVGNAILNFQNLISIFITELADIKQELCIVIISGALSSLGQFLRLIDKSCEQEQQ